MSEIGMGRRWRAAYSSLRKAKLAWEEELTMRLSDLIPLLLVLLIVGVLLFEGRHGPVYPIVRLMGGLEVYARAGVESGDVQVSGGEAEATVQAPRADEAQLGIGPTEVVSWRCRAVSGIDF